MTEKNNKAGGATIAVKALPDLSTYRAKVVKVKYGLEIEACKKLKQGESVAILKETADKLIKANLVEGGK